MLECLGYDGEWYPMPTVSATATSLTVNDNGWNIAPFNLPPGGKVYCHIRSSSKWGWGIWSPSNDAYALPNCNPVVAVIDPVAIDEEEEVFDLPCACNSGCKSTGCNGCCGKD